jgi:hypothetical protein
MYKLEIKIGGWDLFDRDVVNIETNDFEKAEILAKFVEFQQSWGWAVDYDVTAEFAENQSDEEDEEYVYDEETDAWYWYDEENDTWYVYDEASDDWFEFIEEEEEVPEETDAVSDEE